MTRMTRRDAVKAAGLMLGGAVVLGTITGCGAGTDAPQRPADANGVRVPPRLLSAEDEALLLAFADTLLPDTAASPGARQAGCGPAMNLLASDCLDAAAQQRITTGIAALRTRAPGFASMPPAERETLLRTIDAEAVKTGDTHWCHALRDIALRAYFSSQVGVTKALRYVREPGRYVGVVPLTPGQPAWS